MSVELLALLAGVAALLKARGRSGLASQIERAQVEISPAPESWSMGSRVVSAHHVVLILEAEAYADIVFDAAKLEAVRGSFSAVMRTPETELAELSPVLKLPLLKQGWHHAYRDAPARAYEEEPLDPALVQGGARALLSAMKEPDAEAILSRGHLSSAEIPGGSLNEHLQFVRYVIHLLPEDYARVERDTRLFDKLKKAVHAAATRADFSVADIELGLRHSALGEGGHAR